jgi:bifunctional UDP-N-acetylglucosamine pyrophosphorylase/glucosamine-1-phosphate N-acetyltransferase
VAAVSAEKPIVVLGEEAGAVRDFLAGTATCVVQDSHVGIGHTLLQVEAWSRDASDLVLVTCAHMPLLRPETLQRLVKTQQHNPGPVTLLAALAPGMGGMQRVAGDSDGSLRAIEKQEAGVPGVPSINELNLGIYCFRGDWLWDALHRLPISGKGEGSLADALTLATAAGLSVSAITVEDQAELMEVLTRLDLAEAESVMRRRINTRHMLAGVTIIDPATTYIQAGVTIGADTVLWPNTHLQGKTTVGESCEIGPDTVVRDSTIAAHCKVFKAVVEGSWLEEHVDVGPYAHLRKGAHLCQGVHMGNFGEVKDSTLGAGTKMGHFSYIGNAQVGQDVNIGAGTITCNYDGVRKNPTEIGEGAFIGSDTMLVAPVKVGKFARTGAGAVVTRDVPDETLVVGVPARPIKKLPRPVEEEK